MSFVQTRCQTLRLFVCFSKLVRTCCGPCSEIPYPFSSGSLLIGRQPVGNLSRNIRGFPKLGRTKSEQGVKSFCNGFYVRSKIKRL